MQPPKHVLAARQLVIQAMQATKPCTRCGGEGVCEHIPTWLHVQTEKAKGKVCFRCKGDGIEPKPKFVDPLVVRYAVAARLLPLVERGEVDKVRVLEDQSRRRDTIYWPVLDDVYTRALVAAKRNQSVKDS
jgi:hypothetical protein